MTKIFLNEKKSKIASFNKYSVKAWKEAFKKVFFVKNILDQDDRLDQYEWLVY